MLSQDMVEVTCTLWQQALASMILIQSFWIGYTVFCAPTEASICQQLPKLGQILW